MVIYIKNMVCDRCRLAVSSILQDLNYTPLSIKLGEVDLGEISLSDEQLLTINKKISEIGFELLDDKNSKLIEKVKNHIISFVHNNDNLINNRASDYLKSRIHYDYNYLSNMFSSTVGTTIEQYVINQKIERAKELLFYNELSLTEISYELGYSSLSHLSSQFKKVTGIPPSEFKKERDSNKRLALDKL